MRDHFREGLLAIFARGAHCLWCPKSRWSPRLGASMALKIDKNEQEERKLQPPPKVRRIVFPEQVSMEQLIAYF
jgi:hypothetical protein